MLNFTHMAIYKRQNNLRNEENTGFGTNSSNRGGRFYNREGGANVFKKGVGLIHRYSWYHTMLGMRRSKFLLLLFLGYICVNLVFAVLYYLIGIEHLAGINAGSPLKNFTEVFFFSTQTFTTVGYGRISPTGFLTSALATLEAFLGLLSLAIATGLFYGRFSRPRAFLKFSHNAVVGPFRNGTALMFRTSPFKNNFLSEAEVKLTVAMEVEENGKSENRFYNLDVEISKINSLALSWTIVHPIDEKSPFYGMTHADFQNNQVEIFVYLKAFDEVFSNSVVGRTSYISEEIVWGARFKLMYHPSHDKSTTVLDLAKLDDFDMVEIPPLPVTS